MVNHLKLCYVLIHFSRAIGVIYPPAIKVSGCHLALNVIKFM